MRLVSLLLIAAIPSHASAQSTDPAPGPVVVTGKKKKACIVETPTGSIIPQRRCFSAAELGDRKRMTERQLRAIGDYKQTARSICMNKERGGGACSMM